MDLGTPIIATSLPGVSDFVQHGVNGYVIKESGPEEISKALLYMRDLAGQRRIFAKRQGHSR